MKKLFGVFFVAALATLFSASALRAQCPNDMKGNPPCPDQQLYKDQADVRINDFKTEIAGLQNQLKALKQQTEDLLKSLDDFKAKLKDCNENLYKMIDASLADVNAFREKLGRLEGKVRQMQRLPDDVLADKQDEVYALEKELNELRKDKISLLPEFYHKIIALAKDINPGLIREKKIKQYVVKSWFENKDCLWNISGNVDIYGDPLQWPKIWQANSSIIRNPDIIHPGQVLQIPPAGPKTPDEIKAERRYWRQKREAMEKETSEETEKGK